MSNHRSLFTDTVSLDQQVHPRLRPSRWVWTRLILYSWRLKCTCSTKCTVNWRTGQSIWFVFVIEKHHQPNSHTIWYWNLNASWLWYSQMNHALQHVGDCLSHWTRDETWVELRIVANYKEKRRGCLTMSLFTEQIGIQHECQFAVFLFVNYHHSDTLDHLSIW